MVSHAKGLIMSDTNAVPAPEDINVPAPEDSEATSAMPMPTLGSQGATLMGVANSRFPESSVTPNVPTPEPTPEVVSEVAHPNPALAILDRISQALQDLREHL